MIAQKEYDDLHLLKILLVLKLSKEIFVSVPVLAQAAKQ